MWNSKSLAVENKTAQTFFFFLATTTAKKDLATATGNVDTWASPKEKAWSGSDPSEEWGVGMVGCGGWSHTVGRFWWTRRLPDKSVPEKEAPLVAFVSPPPPGRLTHPPPPPHLTVLEGETLAAVCATDWWVGGCLGGGGGWVTPCTPGLKGCCCQRSSLTSQHPSAAQGWICIQRVRPRRAHLFPLQLIFENCWASVTTALTCSDGSVCVYACVHVCVCVCALQQAFVKSLTITFQPFRSFN